MSSEISLEQATKQFGSITETLQSLSYYYQNIVEHHEHTANEARQQLDHVQALLKTGGGKTTAKKTSTVDIATIKPVASLVEEAESPAPAPKAKGKGKPGRVSKAQLAAKPDDQGVPLKLQKTYQGKTMLGAIEQVLQGQKGDAINTDEVVLALYGKLKPDLYKVAKDRVTKSLSKGKLEGKWERVPDRLGYYHLSPESKG